MLNVAMVLYSISHAIAALLPDANSSSFMYLKLHC